MREEASGRFGLLFKIEAELAARALEGLSAAGLEGAKYSPHRVLSVPVSAETAPRAGVVLGRLGLSRGELRFSVVQTAKPALHRFPAEVLALARDLDLDLGLSGVIYSEEP